MSSPRTLKLILVVQLRLGTLDEGKALVQTIPGRIQQEDAIAAYIAQGAAIGWGSFRLEHLTPTSLAVSVADSPFARAYGGASAPVCHLTRGVLEALAAAVLQRRARVWETACAATGAARCRFETVDG